MRRAIKIMTVLIFGLVSLICLIGIPVALSGGLDSGRPVASGEVIQWGKRSRSSHYAVVLFRVEGVSYTCRDVTLPISRSYLGDTVKIEYDAGDPTVCNLKESNADSAFFLVFGIALSAIITWIIFKVMKMNPPKGSVPVPTKLR